MSTVRFPINSLRRPVMGAAAVISGCVAASGTALAVAEGDAPSTPVTTVESITSGAGPAARTTIDEIDPALTRSFAVLSRAATPVSEISPLAVRFGATGSLARDAVTAEGQHVTLLPASGAVCLTDREQTTCNETAQAAQGYVMLATFCAPSLPVGQSRITGLVPDGVAEVSVWTNTGRNTVPVHDNVYVFQASGMPRTVAWPGHEIAVDNPDATAACDRS